MGEELRELDAQIAENLFGWEWLERGTRNGTWELPRKAIFAPEGGEWRRINFPPEYWRPASANTKRFTDWDQQCRINTVLEMPRYSTDIAAAMQVVEKMREQGFSVTIDDMMGQLPWRVCFFGDALHHSNRREATLPEAICRAALAAIEGKE